MNSLATPALVPATARTIPSADLPLAWTEEERVRQIGRFRRFLKWLSVPFYVFGPFDLTLYFLYGDPASGILGLIIVGLIPVLLYALRLLDRGELNRSVAITVGFLLSAATIIVFLRPFLHPVLAIGCLLAVVVALPFVSRATLRRLVVVGVANSAFVIAAGLLLAPANQGPVPSEARSLINGVSLFAVVGLIFLMVWLFSSRLQEALGSARSSEATLAHANARLREMDRARTEFMNMTAHEFSTPLTPIRIQLHILRMTGANGFSEEQRAALDMLDRNFARLSHLAADLLDTTRVEAGKLRIDRQPVRLAAVVAEAIRGQQSLADAQGVRCSAILDETLTATADPRRIGQVLDNYLGNALKFTPRGGTIHVELSQRGDQAALTVRDSGAGLGADELAQLFQAFSQVGAGRGAGTGLGLFISRGIVEAHGGRVWVESAGHGKGSTFGFLLPLTQVALAPTPATPVARTR